MRLVRMTTRPSTHTAGVSDSRHPRRPDVPTVEIIGGPEKLVVGLHDYDERWERSYLEHHQRILDALTSGSVGIEHIGSPSVPGLAAKPIIDIVVTVDRLVTCTSTSSNGMTPPCLSTSSFAIICVPMPMIAPSTRAPGEV